MVSKIKKNTKIKINSEKYIQGLLLIGYFTGLCAGSYFIFSSRENAAFANNVLNAGTIKSLVYFPVALILKYSGILSGALCTLTFFSGIQNSAAYCNNILNSNNNYIYSTVITMFKDTAVLMLLILYITIIINQVINGKYNIKKDFKYFSVYFCGAAIINIFEYILKNFIF